MKTDAIPTNNKNSYVPYIILFLVSFILYGNTLTNKYALDDRIVILDNSFTKKGIHGIPDILSNEQFTGFFGKKKDLVTGGRYRPLSMITFAVEYQLFGLNPAVSHFINILLFGILCLLLFRVLEMIQAYPKINTHSTNSKWYFKWTFIASVLFSIHPIHTEVVANLKGRDEIMALLGGLFATYYCLRYIDKKKPLLLLYTFISFFLALLSKEIAIIFLFLIPLAILWFRKIKFKEILIASIPVLLGAIIFLIIRHHVLGNSMGMKSNELMNNPFVSATITEKYATIIYTLGLYVKLLFIPWPLTYDYYPYHIKLMDFSNLYVILSLILYLFIAGIALAKISKNKILSYAILFFLLPLGLVSNVLFPVGAFMNERFIFAGSVGFCMIAGVYIQKIPALKNIYSYSLSILLGIIFLIFCYLTISRNKVWKNDYTLFTTDVKTSSNSAKSNCSAGGILLETAQAIKDTNKRSYYLKESVHYLNKALDIYPDYSDALLLLGNAYWESDRNIDSVLKYYKLALIKSPGNPTVLDNLRIIANASDSISQKIRIFEYLNTCKPNDFETNYQLGNLYGKYLHDIDKAIHYLTVAYNINSLDAKVLKDLGVAYGMNGNMLESLSFFEKALKIDESDPDLYINIGISYQKMGDNLKAQQYINKALEMKMQKSQ